MQILNLYDFMNLTKHMAQNILHCVKAEALDVLVCI